MVYFFVIPGLVALARNPETSKVLSMVIVLKESIIAVLNNQNGCLVILPTIGYWIPGRGAALPGMTANIYSGQ